MSDIAAWLNRLGLSQYAGIFAENAVDLESLPHLTDDDLKALGLPLGHRRKLQAALATESAGPGSQDGPDTRPDTRPNTRPNTPRGAGPGTPATADAERRQLTVLFSDLVGSTELSSRLDPEDMREVLLAYQDACSKVISRYDGTVAKFMGDGVYACFGYPRAHEDDAERAINAALGIVAAVAALEHDLQVRIGVATGTVAVGDIIGEGSAEEAAIIGDAPNLAARLQQIAEPDMVVIGEATHSLTGRLFEVTELGRRDLKGFTDPVGAWAVIRPRRSESRFESTRSEHLTELVGRDEEMEILLRRWQRAKAGEGQLVLISGEPGIGKSRLAQTLQERISGDPHTRLRYQCSPYHTNSALHPAIEHLERAAGFEAGDGPAAKLDKLEALIGTAEGPVENTAPLLADLLSLPSGDRYPLPEVSPQKKKALTLAALTGWLTGLAARRTVLFVLEDAHWIDPTTLEFMEMAVERVPDVPVLMLVTHRPEFDAPWIGRPRVTPMILGRLERRDCARMVENVVGSVGLPEELRDRITVQTDGVPLFVEELTKSVLETAVGSADRPAAIEVPATLQDSLEARLDRIGAAKEVAQIGAVIGRGFDYDLLSRVVAMDDPALRVALEELVGSGLVTVRGAPPAATYTFKHALVQDTAYNSLLRSRRAELHGRIAHVLTEDISDTVSSEPELLAHHFTEAGLVEPAIEHWRLAGRREMERSANKEAIEHLTHGLDLLSRLPEAPERERHELALQVALGPAVLVMRGWGSPQAEACFARARELCHRVGDEREMFRILWGFWMIYGAQGGGEKWHETAGKLLEIAQRQGDRAMLLQAHHAGWGMPFSGDFMSQLAHVEQGLAIYDPVEHSALAPQFGGHDAGVCGLTHKGIALWATGYPDRAANAFAEARSLAERISHPASVSHALNHTLWLHVFRKDWPEALRAAEEAIAYATDVGLPTWIGRATVMRGWALVGSGHTAEGLSDIRRGMEETRSRGHLMGMAGYSAALAEALHIGGSTAEAIATVDEALLMMKKNNERMWMANASTLKGDLLLAQSEERHAEAAACYLDAIDIARDQNARMWELRAATSLARLWQSQGRSSAARDLLAPLYGWFTEGFEVADLKDAKALLEGLS